MHVIWHDYIFVQRDAFMMFRDLFPTCLCRKTQRKKLRGTIVDVEWAIRILLHV